MAHIIWTDSLNTGIDVIDTQHRRIVDYINMLHDTRVTSDVMVIENVMCALVDYTISHFGFEEALMEEAGYEFVRPHKKVHELFIRRIDELQKRFKNGEDILDELQSLLTRWLLNHIKHDDSSYVDAVRVTIKARPYEGSSTGWISRSLARFFRSA